MTQAWMGRVRRASLTIALGCACLGPVQAAGLDTAPSDTILWPHPPARCIFFTPDEQTAFRADDPATWRFRLMTIAAAKPGESVEPPERGYVMKDGLLRELEKLRSGPDGEGATVTVWRSAGEPRLNITMTLRPAGSEKGRNRFKGTLATTRGEGRETIDIIGSCAP